MARGDKKLARNKGSTHKNEENEEEAEKISYTLEPPIDGLPDTVQNYVVLNLDGTQADVRRSWARTILHFRLWCYNNSDERFQFGMPGRSSCVLPSAGNFLIYMHHKSKWLCAVIDGPSGYLDGYIIISTGDKNDIKAKENRVKKSGKEPLKESRAQKKPIYITMADLLPWCGNHIDSQNCGLGYPAMLPAFKDMYKCVESPALQTLQLRNKAIAAGQTLIVHLPEAARSDELFHDIYRNFFGRERLGSERLTAARRWRKDCEAARLVMLRVFPNRPVLKHKSKSTVCTDECSIIQNFRLFHRPQHTHGMFDLKDMPVHLDKDGPVNKQWAEEKLCASLNYDSKTKFLIKKMPNFPSSNNVEQGGNFTTKKEGGGALTAKVGKSNPAGSTYATRPSASVPAQPAPHLISVPMPRQECFAAKNAVLSKGHIDGAPVGLHNLENTCYLNSVIQCLRAVPELKSILMSYSDRKGKNIDQQAHDLTIEAHDLLKELSQSDKAVKPHRFLQMLRAKCPRFQQKEGNTYMQQDAEEFWTELLSTFSDTLLSEENETSSGKIKELFKIDFIRRSHCPETGEVDADTESLYFLRCYMPTDDIKHIDEGIKHGLASERMKISQERGENVTFVEDLKISVLPRYLAVHFSRYEWDKISKQGSKIVRKVDFPAVLNVYEYCSEELKQKLNIFQKPLSTSGGESSNMNIDKVANQVTGVYDLVALLTHQGQTVNSGHYIGWVEQENGTWLQFNDEETSPHQREYILSLSGGGDEQMAFICLYKTR